MRVLHLLQSDRFSGAENVVCQIIGMVKNVPGMEMAYASRDGQIRQVLEERGIPFFPMSQLTVSEVKRVIAAYQPDVIHAHDMRASFVATRACGRIPLVSHIHNNAFDSRGVSAKSIAYLLAARKAKHIFWVSRSSFEGYAFHKLFKKKSSVLYNVIDVEALYTRMQEDTNTYDYDIAFVGRLSYPKNPERLINILEMVVAKRPQTKVAVVGTGELDDVVRERIREKGLDKNVSMLGFNPNPLKLLHDAKLMIMTSRWEGTPMCALEAMALGVPIVSTPTDGLCELVEDGVNGYLSANDEGLVTGILRLLEDTDLRQRMSAETYDRAIRYNDLRVYRDRLLKVYGL